MSYSWDVDCYPEPRDYGHDEQQQREERPSAWWEDIPAFSIVAINVLAFSYCCTHLALQYFPG